ncbi:MAG: hypothetical protein ACE5FU_13635 [Nitrospinota bacterium]
MKRRLIFFMFSTVLLFSFLLNANSEAGKLELASPPKSLEKFYPPNSTTLEFTAQMTKMSQSLTAILIQLKEGNGRKANSFAERLLSTYKETAKMVPEWKDLFVHEKVIALKESLGSGSKESITNALKELKKNCVQCHNKNRIPVWSRFHWPPFKEIVITDPEKEDELKYRKYMEKISNTFNSISVFFEEKEYRKAKKSLRSFKSRFMELKSTCSKCHVDSDVKKIFFGDHITGALDQIKSAVAEETQEDFRISMDIIRKRGCKMCHLTHLPYSIIKAVWEEN